MTLGILCLLASAFTCACAVRLQALDRARSRAARRHLERQWARLLARQRN